MRFCDVCGTELSEFGRYCSGCGTEQDELTWLDRPVSADTPSDEDRALPPDPLTQEQDAEPISQRRRNGWIVTSIVLMVLAATGGVTSAAAFVRGTNWQNRAQVLQANLAKEKTSVARLEDRLMDLSGEKAEAEDERDQAEGAAESYRGLANLIKVVADDLDACVTSVEGLLDVLFNIESYSRIEGRRIAGQASETCGIAKAQYAELNLLLSSP